MDSSLLVYFFSPCNFAKLFHPSLFSVPLSLIIKNNDKTFLEGNQAVFIKILKVYAFNSTYGEYSILDIYMCRDFDKDTHYSIRENSKHPTIHGTVIQWVLIRAVINDFKRINY